MGQARAPTSRGLLALRENGVHAQVQPEESRLDQQRFSEASGTVLLHDEQHKTSLAQTATTRVASRLRGSSLDGLKEHTRAPTPERRYC